MMPCKRCVARGKPWAGEDPKCAFPDGLFTTYNWNCATMNTLRNRAEAFRATSDDQSAGLVPAAGAFVVLYWYKNRGRTEIAGMIDEHGWRSLTLQVAEEVLDARYSPGW